MSPTVQKGLFDDVANQLETPWWACLGGCLAAAGVLADGYIKRNQKRRRAAEAMAERRRRESEAAAQAALDVIPLAKVELPRTVRDCRGPGICPVIRCEFNVLLDVRRIENAESIIVGARGGHGEGVSLAGKRNSAGQVKMRDLDEAVDAVVALAEKIPSTCVLDYVENPDLIPGRDEPEDGGQINTAHMTLKQIAQVFGVTRERVRMIEIRALHKLRAAESAEELDPTFVPVGALTAR